MESVGKNVSKTSSAEQLQSRLEREKLDSFTSPHTTQTSALTMKNMKL
jgi:hypothetical protein